MFHRNLASLLIWIPRMPVFKPDLFLVTHESVRKRRESQKWPTGVVHGKQEAWNSLRSICGTSCVVPLCDRPDLVAGKKHKVSIDDIFWANQIMSRQTTPPLVHTRTDVIATRSIFTNILHLWFELIHSIQPSGNSVHEVHGKSRQQSICCGKTRQQIMHVCCISSYQTSESILTNTEIKTVVSTEIVRHNQQRQMRIAEYPSTSLFSSAVTTSQGPPNLLTPRIIIIFVRFTRVTHLCVLHHWMKSKKTRNTKQKRDLDVVVRSSWHVVHESGWHQ